jgi:hypothetical protein
MIIRDLNIMRAICIKTEADAPLIINTDTPLAYSLA